jgi:hypothetical protein
LVVVVRNGAPLWVILAAVILVIMVAVAIVVLLLTKGTVVVLAIPGFSAESVILGLGLGVLLLAFKRRKRADA